MLHQLIDLSCIARLMSRINTVRIPIHLFEYGRWVFRFARAYGRRSLKGIFNIHACNVLHAWALATPCDEAYAPRIGTITILPVDYSTCCKF